MHMKRLIFGSVLFSLSACGFINTPSPWSEGNIVVAGDAEGMRAFGDTLSGLITNAKTTDPEGNSAHWKFRDSQEQWRTKRTCKNCGFVQKILGTQQGEGS